MPEKIIMIKSSTLEFVKDTLEQNLRWLRVDARYAHSNSEVRKNLQNVLNAKSLLNNDIQTFQANASILEKIFGELNAREMQNSSGD